MLREMEFNFSENVRSTFKYLGCISFSFVESIFYDTALSLMLVKV